MENFAIGTFFSRNNVELVRGSKKIQKFCQNLPYWAHLLSQRKRKSGHIWAFLAFWGFFGVQNPFYRDLSRVGVLTWTLAGGCTPNSKAAEIYLYELLLFSLPHPSTPPPVNLHPSTPTLLTSTLAGGGGARVP